MTRRSVPAPAKVGSRLLTAESALDLAADGRSAWFAGVLVDGRRFTAYVEDNGEPGRNDVFRLWAGAALLTGDGKLTGGNVQIHRQ